MSCMSAAIAVGAFLLAATTGLSVLSSLLIVAGSAVGSPLATTPVSGCLAELRCCASAALPRLLPDGCALPSLIACRRAVTSCSACPGDPERFGRLARLGWLAALVVLTASNGFAPRWL